MLIKRLLCCLACCVNFLWAGLAENEKALKAAVQAKNGPQVVAATKRLLAGGDAKGIQSVLQYALLCDNYETEKAVAWELAQLPEGKRDLVRKAALKHRRYEVRVVLAAVMAIYSDATSFETLCAMAGDKMPSVSVAALSHIVRKDDLKAVDHLIKTLTKCERYGGVVPNAIQEALRALTGVKDDYTAREWEKWWSPRRNSFTKADARNQKRTSRTVVRSKNSFFGVEVVSKHILFILDMSDSMIKRDEPISTGATQPGNGGRTVVDKPTAKPAGKKTGGKLPLTRERLYRVQQELIKTIRNLSPDTYFTIMAYNHQIKMLHEKPQRATDSFKKSAVTFVNSFRPEGETWTDTALKKAFVMAKQIDTIFLLSDGYPQRKQQLIPMESIKKYVEEQNRFRKIQLNTIGFVQVGRTMARFLSDLAKANGGKYRGLQ